MQVLNEELYDTIQISQNEKPVVSVRAGKNVPKQRIDLPAERPRTQPRQSNTTLEVSTVEVNLEESVSLSRF